MEESKRLISSSLNQSVDNEEDLDTQGPLDRQQIKKAKSIINNKYPLKFLRVNEVLPFCCCLRKKSKTKNKSQSFDSDRLREIMWVKAQRDLDQTQDPDSETNKRKMKEIKEQIRKMIRENPFSIYGIGIMAQFNIMKHLIFIFAVLTLLLIPNIALYSHHNAMKGLSNFLSLVTLGNFGFSSASCFSVTKEIGTMTLFCNTGFFKNSISNSTFGIATNLSNDFCKSDIKETKVCKGKFDEIGFNQQYVDSCAGK